MSWTATSACCDVAGEQRMAGSGEMAASRRCDQCGTLFEPGREHARFCSAGCRVAWNRENSAGAGSEQRALDWSGTAMREAAGRLTRPGSAAAAGPHGFVLVSEAVWWVTIVDATLVRYHPDVYDAMLAALPAAEREVIEGTLAGLRFVRNWMGYHADHADFIQPRPPRPADGGAIAAWTWRSLPEPAVTSFTPQRQEWERSRYLAYERHLAGRAVSDTFPHAVAFLTRAVTLSAGPAGQPAVS